ncbi:MAG: hypothetical protein P8X42_10340 [Calditrichaceae bacterium]|jgi:hypothetical protein
MNKIRTIIGSFVLFILLILFSMNMVTHNHAMSYQFHENCPACILGITFHAPDFEPGWAFQTENPPYKIIAFTIEEPAFCEDILFFYLNKAPPVC